MATEIAKAYIQIIPTTKGIQGALEDELTGAGDSAGKASGKGFLSGMGGVISKGAKVLGAAATAAAGGLAALTGKAVAGYADFEQLVGGVETLFGDSADIVQTYADIAYKTAGVSANQYMETVTSFSASLLQSLEGDTKQAAEIGNMAILDMSDNANKMGTDFESIQVAYQSFARGQYQLLDNLKLGYGGTKTEMERLLADAEAFSGIHYDISSLADVYEAIHVVQTEMGITGTTALEASTTISGSVSSMQAAWSNLVTGLADANADMDMLIAAFVGSLIGTNGQGGVINNVMQTVQHALSGIGGLIVELAPIIGTALPQLINTVLPDLLSAASSLVMGIIDGIIDNLPFLMETGLDVVMALCEGLVQNVGAIMDGVVAVILGIVDFAVNNMPKIVELGLRIIKELAAGLIRAIPQLVGAVPQLLGSIITTFIDAIPQIWEVGKQIVNGVWDGIKKPKTPLLPISKTSLAVL